MFQQGSLETQRALRYKIVFSAFLLGAASLAAHLFFLQLNPATRELYCKKVEERWHSYETPHARRGDIYYRNGTLLAGTRKVARVIVEPQMVLPHLTETSEALAPYLHKPAEDIAAQIAGFRHRGMELADGLDLGTALAIDRAGLSGVFTRYYYERTYPHGAYCAAATLGYAGPEPYQRLGLEKVCDAMLSGEDGKVIYRKDSSRQRLPGSILDEKAKHDGSPLYTTLHPSIQTICEEELRSAEAVNHAEWGCILVMDPRSGEILGASTSPTFDPNAYVHGEHGPEANVLVHNAVEPGSTVKPLLAAYAVDRGWIDPAHKYVCNRALNIGKHTIHEAEADEVIGGNAGVPVSEILIHSSNIGMAKVALELGQDKVREAYDSLGFFHRTGIELPGESRGIRPCSWQKKSEPWPKITLATTGFGQGMGVTPLQLATAYCTLANGGYKVQPTLLLRDKQDVQSGDEPGKPDVPDGEIVIAGFGGGKVGQTLMSANGLDADRSVSATGADAPAGESRIRVLSPETCAEVTGWLEQVTLKGTGKKARLERFRVAGKTGTAQIHTSHGGYSGGSYLASFIGYFPVEQPRYVVLVMFSRPRGGYYGGAVAAPVFKKVGDRISYIDELALRGSEY